MPRCRPGRQLLRLAGVVLAGMVGTPSTSAHAQSAPLEVRPGVEPAPRPPASPAAESLPGPEIVAGPPELLPGYADRRVPVVLVPSSPGLGLRIRPAGDVRHEARCAGSCVATVKPGAYELELLERGEDAGSLELDLRSPERLTLTPPDAGARRTGLILGIAGSVVFEAGVLLTVLAYSSLSDCGGSDCDDTPGWVGPAGLGSIAVGATVGTIGWVMFANNARPAVERQPVDPLTLRPAARRERPIVTAAVRPLHDGLLLGSSLKF